MTTKEKSRIRFCSSIHAKESRGIFMYSGVMKRFFHSIIDAVTKYKWFGSWKDGNVMTISTSFAFQLIVTPPPGTDGGSRDVRVFSNSPDLPRVF